MRLEKPDKETALKYDYMLCEKKGIDWKAAYRRAQIAYDEEIIEQGNMTDFEYYKTIYAPKYNYYLIDDDGRIIGGALVSKNGTVVELQYVNIEKDMRHKGYGKKMFEMIEQDIFQDSNVSKIHMQDASQSEETSAIATKLGYTIDSKHDISKPNPNYKQPDIDDGSDR